jgi:hypothetical protein
MAELNKLLEPLHKRVTAAIREVDPNHIIMLGAPEWNGNFDPFTDWTYDDNIMYTCHRYGGDASVAAIGNFIAFKEKTNLPMYMGEIGHNTEEWQEAFCIAMEQSNIGYTFWPYKKIRNSCFAGITPPENWDKVIEFSEAPRSTYFEVRAARPDQKLARKAMLDFIEASRFDNCTPQDGYIKSLRLN